MDLKPLNNIKITHGIDLTYGIVKALSDYKP